MSDPRYEPKDYLYGPQLGFGKNPDAEWDPTKGDEDPARLLASQIQHVYAMRIRAELKSAGFTIREYAERTNQGYDRVAKFLGGRVVMNFEDVARAELELGGILRVTVEK